MAYGLGRDDIVWCVGANNNGSGRWLPHAPERTFVGQDNVHAGGLDPPHQLDRAREFAFKRPNAGDLLHERGQAERTELIVKLIASIRAVWQAFLC
jgi:hypothetical protein